MKKTIDVCKMLLPVFLAAFLFVACAPKEEASDQNEEAVEVTEEAAAEEEEEKPSPLKSVKATVDGVAVTLAYGSPAAKGRAIWGELVPYDKVWRTGADEATWVMFDKDVMFGDKKVEAGKYGLFTIPGESIWTVILNKTWDQWGAYTYKEGDDVARVTTTPETTDEASERLTFQVSDKGLHFMWENLALVVPIAAAK